MSLSISIKPFLSELRLKYSPKLPPKRYRFVLKCLKQEQIISTALGVALSLTVPLSAADALLNSPNANIARSADVALRRSIPAFNRDLFAVRQQVENIGQLLRIPQRKNWGAMLASVETCLEIVTDADGATVLEGTPQNSLEQAQKLQSDIKTGLERVRPAIQSRDADATSIRISNVLLNIGDLEIIQAPGLPYLLPREYKQFPYLKGRANVILTIQRNNNNNDNNINNNTSGEKIQDQLQITVDGYSAPLSGGNFVRRVLNGEYNNTIIKDNSVSLLVQSNKQIQQQQQQQQQQYNQDDQQEIQQQQQYQQQQQQQYNIQYDLPLEILPLGGFEPIYKSPLEVQDGELPVLPLSIYGSVAMSQTGSEGDSFVSPTDWFIYKFDRSQAGLAGLAFDEGKFGVFGYVTKGLQKIGGLQSGDVIVKAEVTSGRDQLVLSEKFQ